MTTAAEAVRKGAAFLDDAGLDGWRDRINLETLDIGNGTVCILGQLYSDYWVGKKALGLLWKSMSTLEENDRPRAFGFVSGHFNAPELTDEWREYLRINQTQPPAVAFTATGERTYTETQVSEMLTSIAKELERVIEAGTAVPLTSWGIVATAFYDLKKG